MRKGERGKVYLVGAGPGDPGLLTLKARECILKADVIVYDNLANRTLLKYANDGAELVYVGKKAGCHTMDQEEINELIIDRAQKGHMVVRLKGGDPFVFGRGGEEAQGLSKSGLDFEIVPGITSAIAVPAYAGIPLTHRNYTSTVAFITGHEDPFKGKSDVAWDKLATGAGTLVFLMGVGNIDSIASALIENGRASDTPVAVIYKGTVAGQRTIKGKLEDIGLIAKKSKIKPPAVIVVGDVVMLREELNWFEKKPLFGKRIVVTRARDQASKFLSELTRLGAECIEFPTIEIQAPESWIPIDRAIGALEGYQWLLFTSVNGVKYFLDRLKARGKDVRDLKGLKIATIGPKTAEILGDFGIRADLIPEEYRAEAVLECFKEKGVEGKRILVPRALQAREVLPAGLKKIGAYVDVVPAYRTRMPNRDTGRIRQMFEERTIDMVTFTSSSTVKNFAGMFKTDGQRFQEWMAQVAIACIGPVTADSARKMGFDVDLISPEYTIDSLIESIVKYFTSGQQKSP